VPLSNHKRGITTNQTSNQINLRQRRIEKASTKYQVANPKISSFSNTQVIFNQKKKNGKMVRFRQTLTILCFFLSHAFLAQAPLQ
jgi:hypothetical protein